MSLCVYTLATLRRTCTVDGGQCWNWTGGCMNKRDNTPRVYTIDYATGDKRVMSGPLAAWNIAHEAPPKPGHIVYRRCGNSACLNPSHLDQLTRQSMWARIALSGRKRWKKHTPAQREAWLKTAAGKAATPAATVAAIRAASPDITGRALAAMYGVTPQVVSRIRRGVSHRGTE